MRSFTCFYGHGQGLGRAHGHGQGLGRAHGHGQGHGRAHGFLLHFYDDFYRYVAGQVSLAKSVPPYNYDNESPSDLPPNSEVPREPFGTVSI